jgi:DNA-binding response OmpR family regulator
MHALVIDDEYLIAATLGDMLGELGFASADFATNAADAERAFRKRRPDLITEDYRLRPGEESGVSLAHRLANGSVPIIYVTASTVEVRHLPMACHVQKPFTLGTLDRAIRAAGIPLAARRR